MKGVVSQAYVAGRKAPGDGTCCVVPGEARSGQSRDSRQESRGGRGEGPIMWGLEGLGKATGLPSKWNEKPLEPRQ